MTAASTTPTTPVGADGGLGRWWSDQVRDYLRLRRSLGFELAWDSHLLEEFTAELAGRGAAVVTVADASGAARGPGIRP